MQRNIKLLTILNFCLDLVFWAPVAAIYFSKVAGSYALGMSVFSVVFIASALFEIPTGVFSDRIGRKNTIILGSCTYFLSDLILAATHSYSFLIVAALFQGLARSFFSGNNEAFLYDTLTSLKKENDFHTYLGKTSSVTQIALALSAVSGGFLANISFSLALWVTVVPKVIMVILSFFLIEPKIHTSKQSGNTYEHLAISFKNFKDNSKIKLLTLASVIRFSLGESIYLFRTTFIQMLWPLWAIGFANMLANIGAANGYYFSGKVINRFKPLKILTFEVIFNRALIFLALLFPTIISPIMLSATSIAWATGDISLQSLLQKEFTTAQRATMGSMGSLLKSIGFAIVAFLLGFVADKIGPIKTLIFANLLYLSPILIYRKVFAK